MSWCVTVGSLVVVIAAVRTAQAGNQAAYGAGTRPATGRALTALHPLTNWWPFGNTFGGDYGLGPFHVDQGDDGGYMGDEGNEGDEGHGGVVFVHTYTNGGKAMAFASAGSSSCTSTSESVSFSDSQSVVIDAGAPALEFQV